MSGRAGRLILPFILSLLIGGCTHAISREYRVSALKGLTPDMILLDFSTYKGRLVLMGGEIIETRNLEKDTLIEVLQKPLSRNTEQPSQEKDADGRFWVKYKAFKDPYVFGKGREITVAGVVVGKEVSKIGEKEYTYVILENRETYLWKEREERYGYYGYPYPPYWYPYGPWSPWYYHRHPYYWY